MHSTDLGDHVFKGVCRYCVALRFLENAKFGSFPKRGTQHTIKTPIYDNPYYRDPDNGTLTFGNPHLGFRAQVLIRSPMYECKPHIKVLIGDVGDPQKEQDGFF